jgi:hypothetical protein
MRSGTAVPVLLLNFGIFLDNPGVVVNTVMGSIVHLQLGRAYAMQGDTAMAC